MTRLIMAVCAVASLVGCAERSGPTCPPGYGSPVAVFTLFMGKAIAGRGDLTDTEWRAFVDATISANLPKGYTVFDANGGWMNPVTHKTITEATKVVLVALPDMPESLAAINRIRLAYQTIFKQQLVGMSVEQACGTF